METLGTNRRRMNISLIMPSYKRPELLDLGLWSIFQQDIHYNLEIIVLNEGIVDGTEEICEKYSSKLNIKYFLTGQNNQSRNMVFASNIGIKKASGEIIILSCPEMFHLSNDINKIVEPLMDNKKIISIPKYILFDQSKLIKHYLINNLTTNIPQELLSDCVNIIFTKEHNRYAATNPFYFALYKKELIEIGGYDEDFIGIAGEDDDLRERLLLNDLNFHWNDFTVIHLYHRKSFDVETKMENPKYLYNSWLLKERRGTIIRNKNKNWGNFEG